MDADMMFALPADAMGGMDANMVAAIPADALGGLSADMVAAIPVDAGFVAPTIGEPGFEAFDTAQDPGFVVPTIDQPEFPADFVAPTFDPAVGGFQTEPGFDTVDPGADFVGIAPEPADPSNFAADSQPGAAPVDVPPTAALDDAFTPAPVADPAPTFDPVADAVGGAIDSGASQGASPAPEAVVAESAPEPAPAPEAVVEDAPAPAAPEDPIAG
jgi:hypothetical protein